MRKTIGIFLIFAVLTCCLSGCSSPEDTELIVFAAASLTEPLTELADIYTQTREDVTVIFNFDSSGTLQTQIQEGAECDIFISAGQVQMDRLASLLSDTRLDILENRVVLAVPDGNPAGITSYEDLTAGLKNGSVLLALGNSDVPAGQYGRKILGYCGLDEQVLAASGCISYSSNVKEISTQLREASVDCGILYLTDAISAGLTVVDTATEEMCGQVIYPAAVLRDSQNTDTARDFLEYLAGGTAGAVFERAGFLPMG